MRPRNIGLVLVALGVIFALSSVVYLGPRLTLSELAPAHPVTLQLASLDHSLGGTVRSELWVYHLQGNYTGQAVAGASVVEMYYKRAASGEALPDNTLMGSNYFLAGQQFVFDAAVPVSQEGWTLEVTAHVAGTGDWSNTLTFIIGETTGPSQGSIPNGPAPSGSMDARVLSGIVSVVSAVILIGTTTVLLLRNSKPKKPHRKR